MALTLALSTALLVPPPRTSTPHLVHSVFANLFDQRAALEHTASLLRPGGGVVLSHPLGAGFVEGLHASDPSVVPRPLPDAPALTELLRGAPPLRLRAFESAPQLYLASLTKPPPVAVRSAAKVTPRASAPRLCAAKPTPGLVEYLASLSESDAAGPLPAGLGGRLPALYGPVAEGFGRGSRKLGIPTANLPCSLFQRELAELPCGVYVGWACVRGGVHKACCNVGFSPTFAGEENPEKIVEAHIMADFDKDFYSERMGLLLLGFIREEKKFGSFDELLNTIKADIETARTALESTPIAEAAAAPWLQQQAAATGEEGAGMELLAPGELVPQAAAPASEPASIEDGPPPPKGFVWGLTV